MLKFYKLLIVSLLMCSVLLTDAMAEENEMSDLLNMSLEELLDMKITTASRTEEPLFDTPAAGYVVTGEDIKASGAAHIADALRSVPGLQVARIDHKSYAVSIRGFNGFFANKLLVMKDGMSLYNPTFSGVYWGEQDFILEDVKHIEVVRGPGASVWGANAVNGVINIVSKTSKETQGAYATGSVGTDRKYHGAFRYGGQVDDHTFYRVYGKYSDYDTAKNPNGSDFDKWDSAYGGIRYDLELAEGRDFFIDFTGLVQNSTSRFNAQDTVSPFTKVVEGDNYTAGMAVNSKWSNVTDDENQMSVQLFATHRNSNLANVVNHEESRYDIQYQQSADFFENHLFTWGAGFRLDVDDFENDTGNVTLTPSSDENYHYNVFLQDRVLIIPDELDLILGAKLGYTTYMGTELQPSARLLYQPTDSETYWTSVSRAVRSRSRIAQDVVFKAPGIPGGTITGSPTAKSEKLIAYEAGVRRKLSKTHAIDIAVFYNSYEDIVHQSFETLPTIVLLNQTDADTYGVELSSDWQVAPDIKLRSAISTLITDLDAPGNREEIKSPEFQASTLASWDINSDLRVSGMLRYVGANKQSTLGVETKTADSYLEADLRLDYGFGDNFELSLVGRNLLDSSHPEYSTEVLRIATEVERSFYLQASYRY